MYRLQNVACDNRYRRRLQGTVNSFRLPELLYGPPRPPIQSRYHYQPQLPAVVVVLAVEVVFTEVEVVLVEVGFVEVVVEPQTGYCPHEEHVSVPHCRAAAWSLAEHPPRQDTRSEPNLTEVHMLTRLLESQVSEFSLKLS